MRAQPLRKGVDNDVKNVEKMMKNLNVTKINGDHPEAIEDSCWVYSEAYGAKHSPSSSSQRGPKGEIKISAEK